MEYEFCNKRKSRFINGQAASLTWQGASGFLLMAFEYECVSDIDVTQVAGAVPPSTSPIDALRDLLNKVRLSETGLPADSSNRHASR